MTPIKCSGRDAISGDRITLEFDDVIQHLQRKTMLLPEPESVETAQ